MKLYLENKGQEYIIECDDWEIAEGVLKIYKLRVGNEVMPPLIAAVKDWTYAGEQPFDGLLAADEKTG